MKKALILVFEFLLFFGAFAAGIVIGGLYTHLRWFVTEPTPGHLRYFDPTGLILTLVLYVLILIVEATRKRLAVSAVRTTLALILALIAGFILKFGFAG